MAVWIFILILAYLILGIVKNVLWIWDWAKKKDEELEEKDEKKKLEE